MNQPGEKWRGGEGIFSYQVFDIPFTSGYKCFSTKCKCMTWEIKILLNYKILNEWMNERTNERTNEQTNSSKKH